MIHSFLALRPSQLQWFDWHLWAATAIVIMLGFIRIFFKRLRTYKRLNDPGNLHQHANARLKNYLGTQEQITTPPIADEPLRAIAKDGIELRLRIHTTLKVIGRPDGGVIAPNVIMAHLGASFVRYTGALDSHQSLLLYPDKLVNHLIALNHDQDTGWQLLEVKIIELEVGRNIGAILAKAREAGVDISKGNLDMDQLAAKFS